MEMKYYNEISKGYNELYKEEQLNKIRIIVDNHNFNNKKILDIGCGPCYLLEYLIENNIKFKEYTGIDPSIELMKLNKYYNNGKNIKCQKPLVKDQRHVAERNSARWFLSMLRNFPQKQKEPVLATSHRLDGKFPTFIKSKVEEYKLSKVDVIIIITAIHHFDNIDIIKNFKDYSKDFIFSVLKISKTTKKIKEIIKKSFKIKDIISESKDIIYFLT